MNNFSSIYRFLNLRSYKYNSYNSKINFEGGFMRFSRCLIRVSDLSEGKAGSVIIPKGVFDGIAPDQLFVAIRRRDATDIILHPINDKDAVIYELYCELCGKKALPKFILLLAQIANSIDSITMLSFKDGICQGDENLPCTFDGFVMVKAGQEKDISTLEKMIKEVEIDNKKIIKIIEFYKV